MASNADNAMRQKDELLKQYQRLQRAYREIRAEADDLRGEKDAAHAAQRWVILFLALTPTPLIVITNYSL